MKKVGAIVGLFGAILFPSGVPSVGAILFAWLLPSGVGIFWAGVATLASLFAGLVGAWFSSGMTRLLIAIASA